MLGKEFISAGRAVFTVENPDGEWYTYRISKKETPGKPDIYFAGLLTGPDNTANYTYVGVFNPQDGTVRLTKASRYAETTIPVRVLRWALRETWAGRELPEGYKLHHEGRCGRCGRELTVPESVETGLGPVCAGRME